MTITGNLNSWHLLSLRNCKARLNRKGQGFEVPWVQRWVTANPHATPLWVVTSHRHDAFLQGVQLTDFIRSVMLERRGYFSVLQWLFLKESGQSRKIITGTALLCFQHQRPLQTLPVFNVSRHVCSVGHVDMPGPPLHKLQHSWTETGTRPGKKLLYLRRPSSIQGGDQHEQLPFAGGTQLTN